MPLIHAQRLPHFSSTAMLMKVRMVRRKESQEQVPNPTEHTALLQPSAAEVNNGTITLAEAAKGLSLTSPVNAKGENFSHGQRQVLLSVPCARPKEQSSCC